MSHEYMLIDPGDLRDVPNITIEQAVAVCNIVMKKLKAKAKQCEEDPCTHPREHLQTYPDRPFEAKCIHCNTDLIAEWRAK